MAYQIPSKVKANFLLTETKIDLYTILPQQDLLFKHAIVTLYFKGLIGADFKMRINVYADATKSKLLLSSTPINNQDIVRTNDLYTELRFDFEKLGNVMSIGKKHMVEFEIYDGYNYDNDNQVAIVYDYFAAQQFLGTPDYLVDPADYAELSAKCSFLFDVQNGITEKFFMARLQGAVLINGIGFDETEIQFFPARYLYTTTIKKGLYPASMNYRYTNFGSDQYQEILNATHDFTPNPVTPNVWKNFFYYNPATGELKFYIDQRLNSTCHALFDFYLFFTDTRGKYAPYNLESGFNSVYWQPRLAANLQFDFSQENNLQGLLSISTSGIEVKNQDQYFNDFFGIFYCFSNREVKVWSCEGDYSNKRVDFIGLIRGADLDDNTCKFSLTDPLARLDDTYRDYKPKTLFDLANLGAYYIRIADQNRVVPRVLGKISSFDTWYRNTASTITVPWFHPAGMIECLNVNYNGAFTNANNRKWSCGFGTNTAATMQRDVTAVAPFVSGAFTATKFTIDATAGKVSDWLPPGTSIVNNGKYGIVYASNDTEAYVWPADAGFSAAADIIRHKVLIVVVERDGNYAYCRAGETYTCSIGAAGDLQITFTNNFEALASVGLTTALNPDNDKVYCVFMNDTADARASVIVQNMLVDLGMTTNMGFAPSVPDWDDPDLAITIPFPGEDDLPSVRSVVELCLKSAMACLYFDASGYLRYKSFLQPIEGIIGDVYNESGFVAEDEINQTNSTEFNVKFDMWDLFSGANFTFPHCKKWSYYRLEDEMVKDLYKTLKLYDVQVVLDPTRSTLYSFLDKYFRLVIGRSAVVKLRALGEQSKLWIGDDIQVTRKKIIGDDNTQTLRVISRTKDANGAQLSLMDLKEFPNL